MAGGVLQELARGLVQRDDPERVHLQVLQNLGRLDVLHQGEHAHEAGVGNHDVEVVNAVLLAELGDQAGCILLDRGVVLGHNESGSVALGEAGEGLGAGVLGVAGGSYDGLFLGVNGVR